MIELLKIAIPTLGVLFAFFTWYVGRTISDKNETTKNTANIDSHEKQLGLHEKRLDCIDEKINELFKLK